MNRMYRIIWNPIRNSYIVVSELTKRHAGNNRRGFVSVALLSALIFSSFSYGNAWAADTAAGKGDGVAIGTGSNAPKKENVAIGENATISYSNGASNSTGDVVIGNGTKIDNYASQGGSIAIGNNAKINNMTGRQESLFALGQTTYHSANLLGTVQVPDTPENVAGSIAIGDNTYARSGSIMIGSHNYRGLIGDQTVDTSDTSKYNININATTLGTNSFNQGAFSTVYGAYSIISGKYNGGGYSAYAGQNFGAVISGSLNSIESATASSIYSGVASSIVGTANRSYNSNGALIFGAGNEITNSITTINAPSRSGDSAAALQKTLMDAVSDSEGGGATLAIGGGNKADYTQKTSIIGVNNTVTGTAGSISSFNSVTGFKNTATNVKHVTVIGTENTVTDTTGALIFGDNREVSSANGSIIIGSSDNGTTTTVANAVAIGKEANVTVEGGVALGAKSVASTAAGAAGYDPSTKSASTDTSSTWKATDAAVSVGDGTTVTRQITSVAAGTNDTDAVNVAQLKKAMAQAADGNDTLVSGNDGLSLSGNTLSMTVKDTAGNTVTGSVDLSSIAGSKDTRNTVTAGDHVSIDETSNSDGSSTYRINVKADGKIEKGNTSIVTGDTVYNETRPASNGTYIRTDYSAGENLTVLDREVKNNADNINRVENTVNRLGDRVNRAAAGAAALAALHPLDFAPDDKWDFAAGYGNYNGANAAAIGAFYRPSEDTMISIGGSFGGGENMVNAGVSFKLGQHNNVNNTKVAMAKEILDLKKDNQALHKEIEELKAMMKSGTATHDINFPDVPKDHWAYNYVKTLADKGYLTGFPDGEFKGNRTMTRYEYAAIIYRALQNGAPNDTEMARAVNEFEPELKQVQKVERFRVDTVVPNIERIHLN